jgi:hypothetical protein
MQPNTTRLQLANENKTYSFLRYFSKELPAMGIIQEVSEKLAGNENLIAISIKLAIQKNVSAFNIIETIKSQATDNYNCIAFMLGNKLTTEILNF